MATVETDAPVVISTAPAARGLAMVFGFIAAIWVTLTLFLIPRYGHHIGMRVASPPGSIVAAIWIPVLMASAFPLLALYGAFGRTTIDARGVTDKRLFRQPRRLDWSDVRRVRWTRRVATLQGDWTTIAIAWEHGKGTGADKSAREIVQQHLEPHFDLSLSPSSSAWTWRSTWRVGVLASVVSSSIYLVYRQALMNPAQARVWVGVLVGSTTAAYLLVCIHMTVRAHQAPDGYARWRTRLA